MNKVIQLLPNERIAFEQTKPKRIFSSVCNGKTITRDHKDYGFMDDGRLQPETDLMLADFAIKIGGYEVKYIPNKSRDTKGYDGIFIIDNETFKVSGRTLTERMEGYDGNKKRRGLIFHKSGGNGGGRGDYKEYQKIKDISEVAYYSIADIRDNDIWRFYIIESELIKKEIDLIPQKSYKYNWTAEDFDEKIVKKYGYIHLFENIAV